MCTAVSFQCGNHYFGRNLDLEYSYGESVVITPRYYPLNFRKEGIIENHYAIIGMALVQQGYPLYFDATNEYGLSAAGLNFPGNAFYQSHRAGCYNVTPFELIPWILSRCKTVPEAVKLLKQINVLDEPFNDEYPLTPLHWIVADNHSSVIVEPLKEGIEIYDNPVGVLTNNPPFAYHMANLQNYLNLTPHEPENRFSGNLNLTPFSRGTGAFGLPGDLSSSSRFIRAAFTKWNALPKEPEEDCVGQFFHILDSVSQTEGCCITPQGYEKTVYSSCCNTDKLIYYYTSYTNRQITAVPMLQKHMDSRELAVYQLITDQQILYMS